jgi:hypothetical protein
VRHPASHLAPSVLLHVSKEPTTNEPSSRKQSRLHRGLRRQGRPGVLHPGGPHLFAKLCRAARSDGLYIWFRRIHHPEQALSEGMGSAVARFMPDGNGGGNMKRDSGPVVDFEEMKFHPQMSVFFIFPLIVWLRKAMESFPCNKGRCHRVDLT